MSHELERERDIYRRAWHAMVAMEMHARKIERGSGLLAEDPESCRPCARAALGHAEAGCQIWIERNEAFAAAADIAKEHGEPVAVVQASGGQR